MYDNSGALIQRGMHNPDHVIGNSYWDRRKVGPIAVDILTLFVRDKCLKNGWRDGGKNCKTLIVVPVVKWWIDPSGSLDVDKKYESAVNCLIDHLDKIAWTTHDHNRTNP